MSHERHKLSTSDFLHHVVRDGNSDRITLIDLMHSIHERGFGLLTLIFSLPLAIPMPYIPGLTTILAAPLLLFSIQMMIGSNAPWLPKWLAHKSIRRQTLAKIIEKASPILRRFEKLLRLRLDFISSNWGHKVIGFFMIIFTISIAIPLPLTNLLPAIGILLISLGLLSRDGIIIICGILIGVIGVVFTGAVLLLGKKIVFGIIHSIFN
jgi:hypothetical protein